MRNKELKWINEKCLAAQSWGKRACATITRMPHSFIFNSHSCSSKRAKLEFSFLTPHFSFILALIFLFSGCARMGSPDGGWYDDTPPRVVSSTPVDRGTNAKGKRVTINFNEYIKIEDAQNKVIVSPPQMEAADIKAAGKRIVIELKDTLKENTTYTIDFSDAISDNNESNPMGNYTFSFATGKEIDTLEVSGYCLNAEDLEPIKGILVGLYEAPADSALADSTVVDSTFTDSTFHKKPFVRVSRTNGSGRFTIKGVAPGNYYVYALQDADGDFVYRQKSETIGFSEETVTPSCKPDTRQDTVWTDSLHINKILRVGYTHFLPDDVTLLCFQAPQTDRYLIKTERKEPEKLGFFFSYGSDSLPKLRGLNFEADSAFVIEPSQKRDTLYYWLRDTALVNIDTLKMDVTYLMTDSTGAIVEKTDSCVEFLAKVPYAKRLKQQQKDFEDWKKAQEKKKKRGEAYDSIPPVEQLKPKFTNTGKIAPNQNVYIEMPAPLKVCDTAAIHLYSKIDTLWYDAPRIITQVDTRVYQVKAEWRPGTEYSLEVDSAAFVSIYGLVSGPIKQGIKIGTEDDYSSLVVDISGAGADTTAVVAQLLNGDKVVNEVAVTNGAAEFYYLRAGKYYLRVFLDLNKNGIWDTGDYDQHLQAEPVYYYHEAIECKEKWDVSRNWKLDGRPRYQQKPMAITKQKPDKAKQLRNRNAQRAAEKGIEYKEK